MSFRRPTRNWWRRVWLNLRQAQRESSFFARNGKFGLAEQASACADVYEAMLLERRAL